MDGRINRVILENSTGTTIGFIHEVISSSENVLPGTNGTYQVRTKNRLMK